MAGMTRLTAYEIFGNASDLQFCIGKTDEKGAKYAFAITRGPEHRFKLLVTTSPFAETVADAAAEIETLLMAICTQVKEETDSSVHADCLTEETIAWISREFEQKQVASTWEMVVPTPV